MQAWTGTELQQILRKCGMSNLLQWHIRSDQITSHHSYGVALMIYGQTNIKDSKDNQAASPGSS